MKNIICPHPIKWIRETKKKGIFKVYCEIDKKEFQYTFSQLMDYISHEYSRDWNELLFTGKTQESAE